MKTWQEQKNSTDGTKKWKCFTLKITAETDVHNKTHEKWKTNFQQYPICSATLIIIKSLQPSVTVWNVKSVFLFLTLSCSRGRRFLSQEVQVSCRLVGGHAGRFTSLSAHWTRQPGWRWRLIHGVPRGTRQRIQAHGSHAVKVLLLQVSSLNRTATTASKQREIYKAQRQGQRVKRKLHHVTKIPLFINACLLFDPKVGWLQYFLIYTLEKLHKTRRHTKIKICFSFQMVNVVTRWNLGDF